MAASSLAVSAEQEAGAEASEEPTIRGRMVAAEVAVPDFTAEWDQIREDVDAHFGHRDQSDRRIVITPIGGS